MKRIQIIIDEAGNPVIQTSGFQGSECTKEVEKLNAGVGGLGLKVSTKDVKYTAEYYQQAKQAQTVSS